MINLGFRPGNNMPNVYVELTTVDRILEGLVVLLMATAWVLAIVFYFDSPLPSVRLFLSPGVMVVFSIMLIWASRAPIRLYNFPVKLNERNYVMQYIIASRFIRVVNFIGNLMLFFGLFIELEPQLNVPNGIFSICMYVTAGLLILSLVVYFILAYRYR